MDTMNMVQSLTNHCFRNELEAPMVKPRRKAMRDGTESESDPDSGSPSDSSSDSDTKTSETSSEEEDTEPVSGVTGMTWLYKPSITQALIVPDQL